MISDDVRTKFVRYFERNGHLYLPSASLVVRGDPSVLLTSAGMQQFKPYYLDPATAPSRRVVTVQKCLRTSDIDEVGDATHHTFFEMLGNFAFGDTSGGGYFKQEAIAYGYEFVTRELGLPADNIWATTWSGEPGIPADEDSVPHWLAVGVPAARIRALNKKPNGERENFWGPTGDSGPCGPCSEIHFDQLGACPLGASDADCGPGHECGRFVELWNLVFNQYFQEPDRTLRPLEHTGIDTGAGLERIAAILSGAASDYETDLFQPLVHEAERLFDAPYGEDAAIDRSLRIIVDHARSVSFMVGDGIFPSNEARGYVARRMLRRAVRYGRQLGRQTPFMGRLARAAIERMARYHPYLLEMAAVIEEVVSQEESRFSETLASGLELLNAELQRLERAGQTVLPGSVAFRLYDTYGFPFELTQEVVEARKVEVDAEGFRAELRARQEQSRRSQRFGNATNLELPAVAVQFVGYDQLAVEGATVKYLRQGGESGEAVPAAGVTDDDDVWLVLDRTPFYAERGGQVGDSGLIEGPHGQLEVRTTQVPAGDLIVHIGRVLDGHIAVGDSVRAAVDETRRRATARHHTATHLLHAALRAELGAHVHQAGSLVAPERLRFDFAHGVGVSPDQRRAVQARVNDAIRRNLEVVTAVMPIEDAMRSGAVALFDEKYGETARVLTIGDVSKELCGGTHVQRTGELGLLVITAESSVGSGMRRVEAVAGGPAEALIASQTATLEAVGAALGAPWPEAPARLEQLRSELLETRRRLEAAERKAAQQGLAGLLSGVEEAQTAQGPFKLLAVEVDAATAPTMERLREVLDWLRDKLGERGVVVLGSAVDGRPQILAGVSRPLLESGLDAGRILNEVAQELGGRGGGRPELAQGGGGDPARLAAALARGRDAARKMAAAA